MEKIIGVRPISGTVFYGGINKRGMIDAKAATIPNDIFEMGMLEYLDHKCRTDGFTKPYIIELSEYTYKYRITVEMIKKQDDE